MMIAKRSLQHMNSTNCGSDTPDFFALEETGTSVNKLASQHGTVEHGLRPIPLDQWATYMLINVLKPAFILVLDQLFTMFLLRFLHRLTKRSSIFAVLVAAVILSWYAATNGFFSFEAIDGHGFYCSSSKRALSRSSAVSAK